MIRKVLVSLALAGCLLVLHAAPASGQTLFGAAVDYAVGPGQPPSLAVADFNKDGVPDLAVAVEFQTPVVDVLLGKGDGTFQPAVAYTAGANPSSIAVGDFNNDGNVDLAVANDGDGQDNTVTILLGNGDGTFQPAQTFTPTGTLAQFLAVADLNHDGKLDLIVFYLGQPGNLAAFLGNGDGTFQPAKSFVTGYGYTSVVTADFNGDGKADLAVNDLFDDQLDVLLGDGQGNFAAPVVYPVGITPHSVTVADFNADGVPDLAVANSCDTDRCINGSVSILLGNGDGTFAAQAALTPGAGAWAGVAADFDGDGKLDLAVTVAGGAGSVDVFLGNGDGTFQAALAFSADFCPQSIVAADLNDDGHLDLATANYTGNDVSVLLNTAALPTVSLSPTSIAFVTQVVGTTSAAQKVTLTNTSTVALSISSFVISHDFVQSNNCGSSVVAGASCTIRAAFRPQARGPRSGTLTITDNAVNSPQTVTLSGTGTVVSLSPTSLNFGSVAVGKTATETLTVTNVAKNSSLFFSAIRISGLNATDFSQTNTCGASIPAGGSCTISVTFSPSKAGTRTATLSIADSGGGSPQTIGLSGSGT